MFVAIHLHRALCYIFGHLIYPHESERRLCLGLKRPIGQVASNIFEHVDAGTSDVERGATLA